MKKKVVLLSCIIFIFASIYLLYTYIDSSNYNVYEEIKVNEVTSTKKKNIITTLKEKYKNNDIVALLEIPGLISVPVAKAENNIFYLTNNLYQKSDKKGAIFMDYRVNEETDKKILAYGHNGNDENLPFIKLTKYRSENFYKKNSKIYLYTLNGKKEYTIFSSYVETKDFDYMNVKSFNGLTWSEHLNKLKNKSDYKTGITVNENSKILILQTCSFDTTYSESQKYQLVMGVLKE